MKTLLMLMISVVASVASFAMPNTGMAKVSVSVTPPQADVLINQTRQFKAIVSGTKDLRVTWSIVSGGAGNFGPGSINSNGLYTAAADAPPPPFVTIRATSVADPKASATATIIVRDVRNYTQFNSDDDLDASAYNDGAFINFGWTGLPFGTAKIVFSRAATNNGPWTQVLSSQFSDAPTSTARIDYTDLESVPPDTTNDYFYKMEAFSATNQLLKSYTPVFLPKFARVQ